MARNSGWLHTGDFERDKSHNFSHPRWHLIRERIEWAGTASLFLAAGIILANLADRRVPFAVLETADVVGAPGETVQVQMKVWRDIGRECYVNMYRSIFDSSGTRFDLGHQFYDAETIRLLELRTPGMAKFAIDLPPTMALGDGAYLSSRLRYVCNPYQIVLPIDVHTVVPLNIKTK